MYMFILNFFNLVNYNNLRNYGSDNYSNLYKFIATILGFSLRSIIGR